VAVTTTSRNSFEKRVESAVEVAWAILLQGIKPVIKKLMQLLLNICLVNYTAKFHQHQRIFITELSGYDVLNCKQIFYKMVTVFYVPEIQTDQCSSNSHGLIPVCFLNAVEKCDMEE
jgi:hypothetical protein